MRPYIALTFNPMSLYIGVLFALLFALSFIFRHFSSSFHFFELLKVFIGILSSVALPQYQKAVNKSRVAGYWPILKNLAEAKVALIGLLLRSTCFDYLDIHKIKPPNEI